MGENISALVPLRLLLIEDSKANAKLLVRELRKGGFDPDFARVDTPQELEAALEGNSWDAVIADYNMPAFSGGDALRIIQAKGLDLPFILISGVTGEEKAAEAMKSGAHDYIMKGSLQRLAPALERELREADVRRERRQAVEELHLAHTELEFRVRRRTAELEVVNEALRAEIAERERVEEEIIAYQEQLRSMATELSLVEERERRKIATALHDQIGQTLAMAGIKLDELRQAIGPGNPGGQVEEIREMITLAIRHSRTLTFELSPPILYELGLEAAVCSLAERYQKEHGIRIDCRDDRLPKPLSEDMRILLFQGVRELLVNAVKHARPRTIAISCLREGADIRVMVEDDGVGFATAAGDTMTGNYHGFGLFSMRERLKHLGGSIAIESAPGRDTRVTMTAPLLVEPGPDK
jgi:signal transduction histidine kinase